MGSGAVRACDRVTLLLRRRGRCGSTGFSGCLDLIDPMPGEKAGLEFAVQSLEIVLFRGQPESELSVGQVHEQRASPEFFSHRLIGDDYFQTGIAVQQDRIRDILFDFGELTADR